MQLNRRQILTLSATLPLVALSSTFVRADNTPAIYAEDGVAIDGTDPVAYFTEGRAVKGSGTHAYRWLGATWQFASVEHQKMFESQPVKYAPQYGGHCADGVALGTITTNIEPTAFRIIDGKLYLNYDPGTASGFEANPAKVAEAENHWPELKAALVSQE